jgi:hypothetical protein
MKVKALVIFMVLLGPVIFDAEGTTLLPVRNHSAPWGLHNSTIVEPDETIKRKVIQIVSPLFLLRDSSYSESNLKYENFVLAH